ncbi:MAG: hypothetical protein M3Z05_17820 [Gemmatimonadota bacterium]|nr:hypothetical protein [Gemmatimonadota bacterium]
MMQAFGGGIISTRRCWSVGPQRGACSGDQQADHVPFIAAFRAADFSTIQSLLAHADVGRR